MKSSPRDCHIFLYLQCADGVGDCLGFVGVCGRCVGVHLSVVRVLSPSGISRRGLDWWCARWKGTGLETARTPPCHHRRQGKISAGTAMALTTLNPAAWSGRDGKNVRLSKELATSAGNEHVASSCCTGYTVPLPLHFPHTYKQLGTTATKQRNTDSIAKKKATLAGVLVRKQRGKLSVGSVAPAPREAFALSRHSRDGSGGGLRGDNFGLLESTLVRAHPSASLGLLVRENVLPRGSPQLRHAPDSLVRLVDPMQRSALRVPMEVWNSTGYELRASSCGGPGCCVDSTSRTRTRPFRAAGLAWLWPLTGRIPPLQRESESSHTCQQRPTPGTTVCVLPPQAQLFFILCPSLSLSSFPSSLATLGP